MTATTTAAERPTDDVLDPVDRISEILFGVIMCLTFTGAISVTTTDDDVRALLVAAIGCNLAWGIVDGVMFVTMGLVEQGHGLRTLDSIRSAPPEEGRRIVADAFPPTVGAVFDEDELEVLRRNLAEVAAPPRPRLRRADLVAAVAVAMLVFLSTFPMVVPFLVVDDHRLAVRASNLVALVMMFGCGWQLGRYAGSRRPWTTAATMACVGVVLVVVTIALGG